MLDPVELYLRFPDRATLMAVAAGLEGYSAIENLHCDGWYPPDHPDLPSLPPDTVRTYWVLDDIGTLYEPTGELDDEGQPIMTALAGYHVNGLWHGSEADIPAALEAFRIYPATPLRVFG